MDRISALHHQYVDMNNTYSDYVEWERGIDESTEYDLLTAMNVSSIFSVHVFSFMFQAHNNTPEGLWPFSRYPIL